MSESASNAYPPAVVSAVTRRYADAYIVARTIDGLGATIKAIGIAVGALLGLGSLITATKGDGGVILAFMGIAIAGAVATILYLLGTLASAQGQILKATLDTAVNSSEFLTAQHKAQVMSLPAAGSAMGGAVADLSTAPQSDWRCRCGQRNPAGAAACLECGLQYGAA